MLATRKTRSKRVLQQTCTDEQETSRSARSLARTDHAPAEHASLHRHVADLQSAASCTDLPPMSRAKAAHTDRQHISRAQSCAYRRAVDQQSRSCRYRQAVAQRSTKLCIQTCHPKGMHTDRQLTSEAQSCAYMHAAHHSKSCADSQATHQQRSSESRSGREESQGLPSGCQTGPQTRVFSSRSKRPLAC